MVLNFPCRPACLKQMMKFRLNRNRFTNCVLNQKLFHKSLLTVYSRWTGFTFLSLISDFTFYSVRWIFYVTFTFKRQQNAPITLNLIVGIKYLHIVTQLRYLTVSKCVNKYENAFIINKYANANANAKKKMKSFFRLYENLY